MYAEAETFLILKYGSIPKAYRAWLQMTSTQQLEIDTAQFEVIMEYEYCMQLGSVPMSSQQ